ncbi:MAG: hypothetical protein V8Q79_11000 [Christensenellales bacterium]
MYLLSTGAHDRLIGNAQAYADTLHAATLLAGHFNPTGFIRITSPGQHHHGLHDEPEPAVFGKQKRPETRVLKPSPAFTPIRPSVSLSARTEAATTL